MSAGVVIAGAGHGAGQAAASLRQFGYQGPITLIGEESHAPYQRPPLSKAWLSDAGEAHDLAFKPDAFWQAQNVTIHTNARVTAIDRTARRVSCDGAPDMDYEHLIIATGGHARRLNCPGADLGGVHVLRTLDDARTLRHAMDAARTMVIVGGGYIGLEVAATARKKGLDVTVLEAENRLLARVAGPDLSSCFTALHEEHGVHIRTKALASGFIGENGRLSAVELEGGERLAADLVLVGIGLVPNDDLARAAGLACDNGIVVDELTRTADPHIFAIGDVANHPNALYGRNLRLESVHNALEQAKTAAGVIAGRPKAYQQVPWFWSDQYDVKLQIAGLSAGFDTCIARGDTRGHSFSLFYLKDGVLIACDAVNAPAEYMAARMMIGRGTRPSPDMLADTNVPAKTLMTESK